MPGASSRMTPRSRIYLANFNPAEQSLLVLEYRDFKYVHIIIITRKKNQVPPFSRGLAVFVCWSPAVVVDRSIRRPRSSRCRRHRRRRRANLCKISPRNKEKKEKQPKKLYILCLLCRIPF